MSAINTKSVVKYVLLPGIGPRLSRLFGSGFGYMAFLMAQIYTMVRLLPENHPYRNPQNIGRFGLLQVIGEAANRLVLDRKNIDQIIIFTALLAAIMILGFQFAFILYSIIMGTAFAQTADPFTFGLSIFTTANPENDVALILLDRVFGVKDFFCQGSFGCTNINQDPSFPWPMHDALHSLFAFYSTGLLIIALVIFLYFVVVVVGETATTGTPFGQRFQNIWVPIRLVLAIGLLVPFGSGLNAAQYVTLYTAKMGSGLATNGWLVFNQKIRQSDYFSQKAGANPTGERDSLIAQPRVPNLAGMIEFMSYAHTCAYHEYLLDTGDRDGDHIKARDFRIRPYMVKVPLPWHENKDMVAPILANETTHEDALEFYNGGDIKIVFGQDVSERPTEREDGYVGDIKPTCGVLRLPVAPFKRSLDWEKHGGSEYILQAYFQLAKIMWFGKQAGSPNANALGAIKDDSFLIEFAKSFVLDRSKPEKQEISDINAYYQGYMRSEFETARELYLQYGVDLGIRDEILLRGWGAAGMFYRTATEFNAVIQKAAFNVGEEKDPPLIMKKVKNHNMANDANFSTKTQYLPGQTSNVSAGKTDPPWTGSELKRARKLNDAYQFWFEDKGGDISDKIATGNVFEDAMNIVLGVEGIFDIRKENAFVHPLVQLSTIGQGMVENTIRNMAVATTTAFLGGALGGNNTGSGKLINAISAFFFSTAFIGLTAGVVLFYVLPFLPFVYFFFALGGWVKTIFEAMVGAPLWALAHMRIDGEGLPGESASNGYFLIFEIMIRPILSVAGLIAAIVIFSAQVRVLNFIWDLVIDNAAGYVPEYEGQFACPTDKNLLCDVADRLNFKRNTVDQFFYTIIYTIVVYLLATASFKLVDMIPDNILRWFGSGVSAFQDLTQDATQGLTQYVAVGGLIQGQQLAGGIRELSGGVGGLLYGQKNPAQAAGQQALDPRVRAPGTASTAAGASAGGVGSSQSAEGSSAGDAKPNTFSGAGQTAGNETGKKK